MAELVNSLEHLKLLSENENEDFVDFFIVIAGGFAKSSKRILYHNKFDEFSIINEIDESFQKVSSVNLEKETNLIEAIEKGALYKD